MKETISKSERKRRFKQEELAAEQLADLSKSELVKLPVSDRLKDEIKNCSGLKGGARKRQVKYLAKVMRDEVVDDILEFLADRKGSKIKENRLHREAERLRDLVINEAIEQQKITIHAGIPWEPDWVADEIDELVALYGFDEGDLRRTVYQYVKSRAYNFYKETFRILKAILEKHEMQRKMES